MSKQALAYGSWPSPITGEKLTQGSVNLNEPQINDAGIFWLTSRPEDKGRTTIVFQAAGDGRDHQRDLLPAPFDVRTHIHEYGGGSYLADGEQVFFVNNADQRVYQYNFLDEDAEPTPLSPEGNYRYSDFCIDAERDQLICVCEIHREGKEPKNCVIALQLDGMLASFNKLGLLEKHLKVAGGYISQSEQRLESIFQPQWSPTGELYFVSDRADWWNIYLPFSSIEAIHCNDHADTAVMIAANAEQADGVIEWHAHKHQVLALSRMQGQNQSLDKAHIAQPETISYNNSQGQTVHGFFYPPTHAQYQGLDNTLPPLLVLCHGGPTAATKPTYNLKVQYWTSRGFAVFDINYSGSTGYGRAYRDRLKGQWGIADVDDICAGADYLIEQGRVNPEQTIIRGGSAGGYSVLAALTFKDTFKAGASLYGIGDLSLLASDTHKFESRYLDQLIGKYPEDKKTYEARSPLLHAEQLNCPVIFLQGLEDKVVPPNQAKTMVAALAKNNVPVAYVTYKNEGHGFRQAATIQHAFAVEYAFYADIFGFEAGEDLPEIPFITSGEQ